MEKSALTGTEKQIAWAKDIRDAAWPILEDAMRQIGQALESPESDTQKEKLEKGQAIVKEMLGKAAAGWWIDYRANFTADYFLFWIENILAGVYRY